MGAFNSHSSDWEDCSDITSSVHTEPHSRIELLAHGSLPNRHSIPQLDDAWQIESDKRVT